MAPPTPKFSAIRCDVLTCSRRTAGDEGRACASIHRRVYAYFFSHCNSFSQGGFFVVRGCGKVPRPPQFSPRRMHILTATICRDGAFLLTLRDNLLYIYDPHLVTQCPERSNAATQQTSSPNPKFFFDVNSDSPLLLTNLPLIRAPNPFMLLSNCSGVIRLFIPLLRPRRRISPRFFSPHPFVITRYDMSS